ncbi:hypothetical protein MHBO_004402 [Bonamia ostreae]|uniref:Uncharacterized protein n=1 Tax=Bonamia ostreae TaxID=126728 RepID=A0ABV2ATQ5_9EUKA
MDILNEKAEESLPHLKQISYENLGLKIDKSASDYNSDDEIYATAKAIEKMERKKSKMQNAVKYDESGNPILEIVKGRNVEDLDPIDHQNIDYESFIKNVYIENANVTAISSNKIKSFHKENGFDGLNCEI